MIDIQIRRSLAIPRKLGLAALIGCLFATASSNPLLTAASIAIIVVLYSLLWRRGEPPALFYAMAYQWLQASILIFYADFQQLPLEEIDASMLSLNQREIEFTLVPATWLSLMAVLALAIGMAIGSRRKQDKLARGVVETLALRLSTQRLLGACVASMLIAYAMVSNAYLLPGLQQPIYALSNLHWVFVYLLAYVTLTQRRSYVPLALVFVLELGVGFLGYFSEFKTVLVVVLLAALAGPTALRGPRFFVAVVIASMMIALGVVWTAIKVDYRAFISKGTNEQVVVVSSADQINELTALIGNLDADRLQTAGVALITRLSYVYFLGEVMQMVPTYIPYEDGALWGDAIYRVFVPRLLDPDKSVIDDSERTAEYTGLTVIGAGTGTSVSLGYVAESYIDFGPVLMLVPLLLWGTFVGWAFKKLVTEKPYVLFGYACGVIIVLLNASVFEQSNAKMVGGFVVSFLVMYLAQRYLARRVLGFMCSRPYEPRADKLAA